MATTISTADVLDRTLIDMEKRFGGKFQLIRGRSKRHPEVQTIEFRPLNPQSASIELASIEQQCDIDLTIQDHGRWEFLPRRKDTLRASLKRSPT